MTSVIQRQGRALLVALQFLTVLPVPRHIRDSENLTGASLLWYPAVGLLLGLLLTLAGDMWTLPFYLQAGLLLALWVALSGGLHLDGFADCVDAWAGGFGDRQRTLQLLSDPLCGSMAVIALTILLLLKYVALAALVQQGALVWLWAVPLLSRSALLLLFMHTNYVRPQGLGALIVQQFSSHDARWVLAGVALTTLALLPVYIWIVLTATTVAVFLLVRRAALQRLGGFTGDVAGALVELVELCLLLVLSFYAVG